MSSVKCGVPLWGTMSINIHVYKFLFESESGTVFEILLKIMAMSLLCILNFKTLFVSIYHKCQSKVL